MLIRVVNGTFGLRTRNENGEYSASVQIKTRLDPPFEVEDSEAERLIASGNVEAVPLSDVATPLCDEAEPEAGKNLPEGENAAEDQAEAHLDPDQLEGLTVAQLKVMAFDMGLDISGCKKKADLVALIAAEAVDAVEDGEAPPDLGVEAPVV